MSEPLLDVRDLTIQFPAPAGAATVVNGVSFDLCRGETLGLVGETGCGKTLTALALLRLVPPPGGITGGQILYRGEDLLGLSAGRMRSLRGRRIAIVFQEPMTALNPVLTIGFQVAEAIRAHERVSAREAAGEAVRVLKTVAMPDPERRAGEYPHQLSGGMRQRALLAIALACRPEILIADEPTTALDVTIQARILETLRSLREEMGLAMLLITHDLGVIAETADRVAVMYCGQIVETAPVRDLFRDPRHPYTRGLLESIPRPGRVDLAGRREPLRAIRGTVPAPGEFPAGCAFNPRCPEAIDRCRAEFPLLTPTGEGRSNACLLDPAVRGATPDRAGGAPGNGGVPGKGGGATTQGGEP